MKEKAKRQQVKETIGAAAMQCFSKYGLEKTTLDDIAKAVGLNKASLYYYYKNKEDIFLEVAVQEGKQSILALREKALQKKGLENRVTYFLQERINYYKNVLNLNRVSPEMVNRLLPKFFELYDGVEKEEISFLTALIKEGIRDGEIIKTDASKMASSLINMADALKHSTEQRALLKGTADVDYSNIIAEMKFLLSLIFKGLKS